MKAHCGTIAVESIGKIGTEFIIKLLV